MAYVIPNTTIKLLRGVALDPTYQNTIYFASSTAQYNYFNSKAKYTLENYSYQRTGVGAIRVGLPESGLHECSYLMFQNTTYENKWFYAFIVDTEYVNDNTSDVFYVIDEVQTWLFDMELKPSMVERTHVPVVNDTIGANINPEPFQLMELVYDIRDLNGNIENVHKIVSFSECRAIVQVADVDSQIETAYLTKYDGNFSGAILYMFHLDSTGVQRIRNLLAQFTQRPDAILGIYLVPNTCFENPGFNDGDAITFGAGGKGISGELCSHLNGNETFGIYTPKNKKLYTYPYNMYEVYTSEGQKMKLRYEFCNNLDVRIDIDTTITLPVQVVIRPTNYKGYGKASPSSWARCCDEQLTLSNFPLCSWTNDYWSSWISQNALPMAVGTALSLAGVLAPAVQPQWEATLNKGGELTQRKIGHFMQLDPDKQKHSKWFDYDTDSYAQVGENAVGALPNAVSALQQMYTASIHADQFRGSANTNQCDVSHSLIGVYGHRAHIPEQQARMIDDFFEKYGYAIGRILTIDRNARPHWTYIKTQGCNITGNCPSSSVAFVKKLYDRGITWWANGDEVGNYGLNNH
ncbi:MAG: hypothetical protein J6S67_01250 [Methanobrevibacter sp.]|nr:hypothetical protein [Methanobrevibacter sp.]